MNSTSHELHVTVTTCPPLPDLAQHIHAHTHHTYMSVTECIYATHNIELLPLFISVLHHHSLITWMALSVFGFSAT